VIIGAGIARQLGLGGSFGAASIAAKTASPTARCWNAQMRDRLVGAALSAAIVGCTWSCAHAASALDSKKLHAMQIIGTRAVATVSGMAVTSAIDGVIGKAFAPHPEGARAPGENLSGTSRTSDPPPDDAWHPWADVRGIGYESDTDAAGHQINVTVGIGRMIAPNLLIGAFAAYESARLTVDALSGRMDDDAVTIGGYAAWRFVENWRIDGKLGRGHVWYEDRAGAGVEGSFEAARWLAGGGLTGLYRAGGVLIQPSSRVYAVWESNDAYADSRGAPQASRDFSDGRVATGAKLAFPIPLADLGLLPYVGAYGDYRFSHDTELPSGAEYGLEDGWSARLSAGLRFTLANGAVATLGGDYGGIGADSQRWSASATLLWVF
jgi:hypothetical protein